jgi:hypothetical protein
MINATIQSPNAATYTPNTEGVTSKKVLPFSLSDAQLRDVFNLHYEAEILIDLTRYVLSEKQLCEFLGQAYMRESLNLCPLFIQTPDEISKIWGEQYLYESENPILEVKPTAKVFYKESIKATDLNTALKPSLSFTLKSGEYLSDVLTSANVLENCIIDAGTGMGKTEFALNWNGKRIICVPTRKLAKRIHKRGIDKGIDTALFIGGTNLENENTDCIVTTYASLPQLYPVFHNSGFTLFIDEIHNATTAANPSFMLKELRSVIDSMPYFSRVIGLTGTPIYNFHTSLKLPIIQVKRDITVVMPYKVIRCKTRTATAAKLVKQSIDSERTPIVFLNNKGGKLSALLVAIKENTGLTNDKILIVNADQSGEVDFETLVTEGVIGDNIKLIVTTSVFKEGNDIYNKGGFDLIIMSNLIASDKRQFRGRFRNTDDVTFTILKTEKKDEKEENPHFHAVKRSFSLRHFADIAANEVNALPTQYSRELHLKTASNIQSLPLYLDTEGVCRICELHLSNIVANEQTLIEAANDTFEGEQMAAYGFTFEGVFNDTDELTNEIKDEMEAATIVSREAAELDYIETLNTFEKDRTIEPTTDIQKQAIDFVLALEKEGFETGRAFEIARDSIKKSDRTKFLRRVTAAKKLAEGGKDKTTKVLQAIQKEFVIGRRYDRVTFLDKVIECLKKDNRIDVFQYKKGRGDKAIKAVELLYKVESVSQRFDSEVFKMLEIGKFEDVLKGCDWVVNQKDKQANLIPL